MVSLQLNPRPRPVFGAMSLVCALLMFPLPIALGAFFLNQAEKGEPDRNGWASLGAVFFTLVFGVIAAGLSAIGGVISGVIALFRGERSTWLAIVGLVLIGGVLALLLFSWLVAFFSG